MARENTTKEVDTRNLNLTQLSICCLLFFFTVCTASAVDPTSRISQYAHTEWTIQDGIFNGTPIAIAQTLDGYIWIGTQAGLVRFDGVRFVPWTTPNGRQLPSTSISSLLAARDGSLWIATAGGLSHWRSQDLTNYLTGQGYINSIVEDRNGTVWITRTAFNDTLGPLCQVIEIGTRCYGKAEGIPFSNGDTRSCPGGVDA